MKQRIKLKQMCRLLNQDYLWIQMFMLVNSWFFVNIWSMMDSNTCISKKQNSLMFIVYFQSDENPNHWLELIRIMETTDTHFVNAAIFRLLCY